MRSRSCWKIGRTGSGGSGRARPLLARLCCANGESTRSSSSSSFSRIVVIAVFFGLPRRAVASAAARCGCRPRPGRWRAACPGGRARDRAAPDRASLLAGRAFRRARASSPRRPYRSPRPSWWRAAVPGQREVDLAAHDADRLHLDPDGCRRARTSRPERRPTSRQARLVEDVVVVGQRVDADQPLDERIVDDDEHAEPGDARDHAVEHVADAIAQEERAVEVDDLALDLHRGALRERRIGGHLLQRGPVRRPARPPAA